ncbi:MAG TPA: cytochrome c peroxidase [Flavisolibacter sp.]|jgi:cytochrome c peroxidase|nr:cytochrome c peroxidase [Flavisolibacter sp.]
MRIQKSLGLISILMVLFGVLSLSLTKSAKQRTAAGEKIVKLYLEEMVRFDSALQAYPAYFLDSTYKLRKEKYQQLAYQFKRVECLFTYSHPELVYKSFLQTPQFQARDFGPPFPDNWLFAGPFGIDPDSVLRTFSKEDSVFQRKFIERSVNNFRNLMKDCNYQEKAARLTDADVMDALRLQMARMSTVGLANGDFVIEEAGMPSITGEFEAWSDMVAILLAQVPPSAMLRTEMMQKIAEGRNMLKVKPSFRTFDRMLFLRSVLIPLASRLGALQKSFDIPFNKITAALNPNALHVYELDALNKDYFSPGEEAYLTKEKANLGRFLFFDPILSDNNERACASCHKPELAFTDGNRKSQKFDRAGDLARNAPTVINSVFQKEQFWDLRATSLEDQLDSVINNTDELHSSFENVIDRIQSSDEYRQLFYAAFPETKSTGIQRKHVKIAIASYERELTGLNSRFDQYIRGDEAKMNASEINGFNLFMGKAKCGTCHYAPLFNGALPPYFNFTDHRSIGVPVKDTMEVYEVDPDLGVSKPSQNPFFHFSFKVPTVRNSEVTAPYMHNGVYKTLEQVINFYDHAGGIKFMKDMRPGMKGLPFFMILPEKLDLTEKEKQDIVAFIKTLTDTTASKNKPDRLPRLSGKYAALDKRRLGGVY